MSVAQPILCPKCGRADAVRKVSAIVAEGTRTGETSGIALGLGDRSFDLMPFVGTTISRSALAAKLAPPAKPAKPLGNGWNAAFTVGRSALLLFVGLLLAGAALCSFPLLINTYSVNRMLLLVPIVMIVLFVLGALVWIVRSAIRDVRSTRNERDTREARLVAWQRATEQWQSLYYCERDDKVFACNQEMLVPSTSV